MPATVVINELNGAGATATDKTNGNIRLKQADNATVDLNNPIPKPASGSQWSFQKWLRMAITGGSFTQLSNARFYTDGSNGMGTGILLWVRAAASYATPAQETASAGYTNAFTFTLGAPLSLGAGPWTGVGPMGNHVVLAAEVQSTASGGMTPAETVNFAWDEI